jgi:hypothetical protein
VIAKERSMFGHLVEHMSEAYENMHGPHCGETQANKGDVSP